MLQAIRNFGVGMESLTTGELSEAFLQRLRDERESQGM